MPKIRASSPMRQLSRLRSKLIIIFCVLLCVLAFLSVVLHSESNLRSSFPSSRRRSRAFLDFLSVSPPKVAFLFLVRRDLPLDFLWGTFFKNADAAKFSIYIHSQPGFVFDKSTTRSAFFFGRQLNNSIQVVWGESSMIEAERLLFKEALYEPANQRFVLLSDSCVPLYNFSYIYNYVMSSPKSFVDSFIDVKGRRYDPKMSPTIPKQRWRKGSQWITLVRKHAEIVVDDDTVFPLFRKFCKRWPPTPLSFRRRLLAINWTFKLPLFTFQKHRNCIPDEHYVQTLLAIRGTNNELERRAVTYTLWNQLTTIGKTRSWHPFTFNYGDAAPQKLKEIKEINHVYNEYEQHNEFCHTNSKVTPCFLFARKFTVAAATRILREACRVLEQRMMICAAGSEECGKLSDEEVEKGGDFTLIPALSISGTYGEITLTNNDWQGSGDALANGVGPGPGTVHLSHTISLC